MSTVRIVLVDTLGEELFSGSSVLSTYPPPAPLEAVVASVDVARGEDEEEEPVPPTLRSSVFVRVHEFKSGEYRRSDPSFHVSEVLPVSRPMPESSEQLVVDESAATEKAVAVAAAQNDATHEEDNNRAA